VKDVEIHADVPIVVEGAVCFETGASRAQAADPALFVYEHHGEGYGWADPGALTCLYDDLIHGRELPPKFVSKSLRDVDTLVALALSRTPSLVFIPNTLKLVTAADLVHRRGAVGMAHIEPDLMGFMQFLRSLFPKTASKAKFDQCLTMAVDCINDYIANERVPRLPDDIALASGARVLDTGDRGFGVAEMTVEGEPLGLAWVGLYRLGFLRGVVFGKDFNGRRHVLGARKSPFVDFKLDMAARLLNEMERVGGELPEWKSDGLWLYGPPDGTTLLVSHIVEVLIRV
jgi:hypothetical protein